MSECQGHFVSHLRGTGEASYRMRGDGPPQNCSLSHDDGQRTRSIYYGQCRPSNSSVSKEEPGARGGYGTCPRTQRVTWQRQHWHRSGL